MNTVHNISYLNIEMKHSTKACSRTLSLLYISQNKISFRYPQMKKSNIDKSEERGSHFTGNLLPIQLWLKLVWSNPLTAFVLWSDVPSCWEIIFCLSANGNSSKNYNRTAYYVKSIEKIVIPPFILPNNKYNIACFIFLKSKEMEILNL